MVRATHMLSHCYSASLLLSMCRACCSVGGDLQGQGVRLYGQHATPQHHLQVRWLVVPLQAVHFTIVRTTCRRFKLFVGSSGRRVSLPTTAITAPGVPRNVKVYHVCCPAEEHAGCALTSRPVAATVFSWRVGVLTCAGTTVPTLATHSRTEYCCSACPWRRHC